MRSVSRPVRRPSLAPAAVLLALAALLASPPPLEAAWPNAPALNLPICTASGVQIDPVIAPDGSGGAFVVWEDQRSGFIRIYAQHVLASGSVDPAWPANGMPIVTLVAQQGNPRVVEDGAGGAIVSFEDVRSGNWDVYAQRLVATGISPGWPTAGLTVCTASDAQNYNSIAPDGAGGAIVAWVDWRNFGVSGQDVYAQRVLASGTVDPAWPLNGRAICTAAGNQGVSVASLPMALVPDGAGGAYVAWTDSRTGTPDIYAQRVLGTGVVSTSWPVDGAAVCAAANGQYYPTAVADGSGGAFVAWQDQRGAIHIYAHHLVGGGLAPGWPADGLSTNTGIALQDSPVLASDGAGGAILFWSDFQAGNPDVYAQHLTASGLDPSWPAPGTGVVTESGSQYSVGAVPDGSGGAIVQFTDYRSGMADVFAQHVLANGAVDSRWPAGGRSISTASGHQLGSFSVISDGAGGMLTSWSDLRSGVQDIYAQRVARFGYLGTPEAEIAGVDDVPNDQGGRVRLSWYASYLDTGWDPNLAFYEVYRSIAPNAAHDALANGATLLASLDDGPVEGERAILDASATAGPYFWEYVTSVSAVHYLPTYSCVAYTVSDSTGAYNPLTAFMIVARSWDGSYYWLSRPDSGYSADNLAPATPAPFSGEYAPGATTLHWNPNTEPDLANYRLYRGTTASFVPGPGSLVAALPDTGHTDAAGAPYFYKLSAVDVHGNESGFALLLPSGTLDAPAAGLPREIALATAWPNPASESARFALALPRAGRVSLGIFDASGRRVRELLSGSLPAGEHPYAWDLRDQAGGRVAPGLYFATLQAEGARITRRFTVLD